jgi:ACS family hexuronate transporter-like MFS transporter
VADWFPKRERALATGIFNSGSNLGALVAPLLVPVIAAHFGWRASFLVTGALDALWIVVWLATYRSPQQHKRLSPQELNLIQSDQTEEPARRLPYSRLLRTKGAWAFLVGKFLTDPVWWFYLYWMPGFLNKRYGLDLSHLGPPLVAIYLAADVGSIGGGWLSSALLKRGYDVTPARKIALLTCALAVVPVSLVMFSGHNLWLTVALVSLAAAAHQGWSANLYTLVSDMFPRSAVGSVVGLGGFGGAIGGMLVAPAIGYWLDLSHDSYGPLFFAAGFMYVITFVVIHVLLPKLKEIAV